MKLLGALIVVSLACLLMITPTCEYPWANREVRAIVQEMNEDSLTFAFYSTSLYDTTVVSDTITIYHGSAGKDGEPGLQGPRGDKGQRGEPGGTWPSSGIIKMKRLNDSLFIFDLIEFTDIPIEPIEVLMEGMINLDDIDMAYVRWLPVTQDVEGKPANIRMYEFELMIEDSVISHRVVNADEELLISVVQDDVPIGSTADVRIRAIKENDQGDLIPSAWTRSNVDSLMHGQKTFWFRRWEWDFIEEQ